MSEDELKAAQALSQEIDRGFPAIPQSQLDDLIPLEGLDGDDEDKIMALYRTIQGPPKETAFTDEQLGRYLAEVRRETLDAAAEEAAKVITGVRKAALKEAASAICTECGEGKEIKLVTDGWSNGVGGFYHKSKHGLYSSYCLATPIHRIIAAEKGQGEGQGRKG